ncbi:MAG: alpha/beta hydrolase-fold protein [Thermoanaerobaculia bacterium]|nr:alpha/beta hydrolase-fold protein [Thermoanaerobaculia bacterium]
MPKTRHCWLRLAWIPSLSVAIFATGCLPFLRSTRTPMTVEVLAGSGTAPCTVLLLPGFWDRPSDFVRHGFAEEVATRNLDIRLLAADAHVGYYRKRTVLDEVRSIVKAERRAGRDVWLAGNSLGGVGALIYARHGGEDIEGALLMAPYLGEPETIAEIRAAGGVLAWAPPGSEPLDEEPEPQEDNALDRDEYARETWQWLAGWHRDGQGQVEGSPRLWMGWGVDDDFAGPAEMAAALLPEGHARPAPGGHDWTAWTKNWRDFLDGGALRRCTRPSS